MLIVPEILLPVTLPVTSMFMLTPPYGTSAEKLNPLSATLPLRISAFPIAVRNCPVSEVPACVNASVAGSVSPGTSIVIE